MVAFLKFKAMKSKLLLLIVGIFVALLIAFTLQSCSKDDVQPVQIISNEDVETGSTTPNGWWFSSGLNNYNVTWTEEQSFSPKKSLKMSTQTLNSDNFAFWAQTITTNIPVGKDVTLKVKVKSNLVGEGISIVIRGDDSTYPDGSAEQFKTTQGTFPISGTFDWKEQSTRMTKVGENIKSLTVYLVYLPNTAGEVYFDDISLTY